MRTMLFAMAVIALAICPFAQFTYLKTLDGTGSNISGITAQYNFSRPVGLEYNDGKLYVSDFDKAYVYIMNIENNTVSGRAGVPGDDPSSLQGPMHILLDGQDGLFIVDKAAGAIKKSTGTTSLLLVGGGTGSINAPTGIAANQAYLYVTETGSNTIRRLNRPHYTLDTAFSSPGSGDGQIIDPQDLQVVGDKLYVANTGNNRIEVLDGNFGYVQTLGRGLGGISLSGPKGLYFDMASQNTYVADTNNHRVVVFNARGYPVATLGTKGVSGSGNYLFNQPYEVLVADGKLFVSDYGNRRVQVFSIGQFTVNETVLEKINSANATVAELLALMPVANRLGISVVTTAQFDIESAYDAMDRRDYGEAQSKASKAEADAKSKTLFAKQEIAVGAKGLAAKVMERIAPYESEVANTSLAADYTSIKNKAADVSGKIERQEYMQATDLALSLNTLAGSFIQKVMQQRAGEKVEIGKETAESLRAEHAKIRANLAAYLDEAKKYKQTLAGESVGGLLQYAMEDIDAGKLDSANQTLAQAEARLSALQKELGEKAVKINAMSEKITAVKTRIAELEGQKVLMYPDFSSARSLLREAEDSLYENPDSASSMAEEALTLAGQASSNAKTLSYTIIGAVVLFGFALLVGGFFAWKMFLSPRKK